MLIYILTAACLTGYWVSWQMAIKDRFEIALTIILILGFALRYYTSCDFFLHNWDERYHALVAKNLVHHFAIPTLYETPIYVNLNSDWTNGHLWLHKPPLTLWVIALSIKCLGVNELAIRIPSIILSTLGIWLTYQIAIFFFNKLTAFIAAALFSVNGLIIEITAGRVATDHIDLFFMILIEIAVLVVLLTIRKKTYYFTALIGVLIGLAVLTKWLAAYIILPIWAIMVLESKKYSIKEGLMHLVAILIVSIIVYAPWYIYIHQNFHEEALKEQINIKRHFTEILDNQGGPKIHFQLLYFGEFLYKTFYANKDQIKYLAIWVWVGIPILIFSIAKTKMQGYILFSAPAFLLITADTMHTLYCRIGQGQNNLINKITYLLFALFICIPFRYAIERIKPFNNLDRNPKWVQELKILNEQNIKNGVLFNYKHPIEAMFYTNLTVYDYIPSLEEIDNILNQNKNILINDNGNLPKSLKLNTKLKIVQLKDL